MISSGKLNKRVSIQHLVAGSPALSEFGEQNSTWTEFAEVWASVEPLQGREFWAQQQVQSEISTRVRVRYLAGVLPNMRVVYASRILDIKSIIDPQEKHAELQLMCSEGVTNG